MYFDLLQPFGLALPAAVDLDSESRFDCGLNVPYLTDVVMKDEMRHVNADAVGPKPRTILNGGRWRKVSEDCRSSLVGYRHDERVGERLEVDGASSLLMLGLWWWYRGCRLNPLMSELVSPIPRSGGPDTNACFFHAWSPTAAFAFPFLALF